MASYTKQTNIDEFQDWTIEEFDAIEENHEFSSKFHRRERAALRRGRKKATRRIAASVAAAVAAVVLIPIGVCAAVNHSRFFQNVFGDAGRDSVVAHDVEVDTGKGYSITTTIPSNEFVAVDEQTAEELVGLYTMDEPISVQVQDHTVTILSAVRDRNILVMEYKVECPTGVTMYTYSESTNEWYGVNNNPDRTCWFGMDDCGGKIYIDKAKSTPECYYCYSYEIFDKPHKDGENPTMDFMYSDKMFSELAWDGTEMPEEFTQELPLSKAVPATYYQSDAGAKIEVSPLSFRLDVDAFEATQPDGINEWGNPKGFDYVDKIDVYYKDGTHYQVMDWSGDVANFAYVCSGFGEDGTGGYDTVLCFNRLVDTNQIDYIEIDGCKFR